MGMSAVTLGELIECAYSIEEAKRHAGFSLAGADLQNVADKGLEMLHHTTKRAGACALMSAMWTVLIRDKLHLPAYCVAGDLFIKGTCVFGSGPISAATFTGVNLDWDGHCWVCVGDFVADASIFRTAYSSDAPRRLKEFILQEFGPGRGLMLATLDNLVNCGLTYVPRYVMNETQLNGLLLGFREVFCGK